MTKINNTVIYVYDINISDNDFVIGSDADTTKKQTKNYRVSDFRNYLLAGLSPETGGTFKISEVVYTGNLYTTPSQVANALNPAVEIQRYEGCIFNVKGDRYILKLQDVTIGVLQEPITDSDFVSLGKIRSAGEGIEVFKGYNTSDKSHEFNSLISEKSLAISYNLESGNPTGEILMEIKENLKNNSETIGISVYEGFDDVEKKHKIRPIISDNLSVTLDSVLGLEVLRINTPSTASIPALYVNDLYVPTYNDWVQAGGNLITNPTFIYRGEGSLAKPFTNSITYTSESVFTITEDTAISNSLLAYLGSGTRINPEKAGQEIIIQNNSGQYAFSGDLNYNFLKLTVQGAVSCNYEDFIIDMDDVDNFGNGTASITINLDGENSQITVIGKGILNSGNTISGTTYQNTKTISIIGSGTYSETAEYDPDKFMFYSDPMGNVNGTAGCNNDGGIAINVSCNVISFNNAIIKVGGLSRIEFSKSVNSGISGASNDNDLKAFYQTGGSIRLFSTSVSFRNIRDIGFNFEPLNGFTPYLVARDTRFLGPSVVWFNKANNNNVVFDMVNCSTLFFTGTQLFNSTNLWSIIFTNNYFEQVNIDFTKVDFTNSNTVSAINTIGNYLIESLIIFSSKSNANASGAPKGTAFINRKTVTAGSFIIGLEYKIATIGSTNFTLIGAGSNTVGAYFTATGVGTGTGTAYLDTRDTLN